MKTLTLAFSPCPNDTFIFDALIHHKIDTEGLEFKVVFEDIETLNRHAFEGKYDITKLSYPAFARLTGRYILLHAGGALGFGVGPLLIRHPDHDLPEWDGSPEELSNLRSQISDLSIGIPGKYTTAHFLLNMAFPGARQKKEMRFSDIEQSLLKNQIDLGLIIHENRFTYQQKGLRKVIDLGDYWEKETGSPIPLAGIMIKRDLDTGLQQKADRLIRKSVEYAFAHPGSGMDFIRKHAQEMDEEVMLKHIRLYVNDYSADLGEKGRQAVTYLLEKAAGSGVISGLRQPLFI